MSLKTKAEKLIKDWEKRKSWDSDDVGSHTTSYEDEAIKLLKEILKKGF